MTVFCCVPWSRAPSPPGHLHLARQPSFSSLKLSRDKTQSFSFQGNYVSSALNAGKNTASPPPCREALGCVRTWTAQRILSQPRQPPGFRVHALSLWSLLHRLFSTAEAGSTPFWGLSFPKSVRNLALRWHPPPPSSAAWSTQPAAPRVSPRVTVALACKPKTCRQKPSGNHTRRDAGAHLGCRDPLIQLGYPETGAPEDILLGGTRLLAGMTPWSCCGHAWRRRASPADDPTRFCVGLA